MPLTAKVTYSEPTVTVTMSQTAAENLLSLNKATGGDARARKTLAYVAKAIKSAGVEVPSDWRDRIGRGSDDPLFVNTR